MNKKIVVLYKKSGQAPVIKIITNMFEIKKMIVQGDLDMVRYENCIIVCNKIDANINQIPNIVLDFKHITGDFFLIGYNPKNKDFRSLDNSEVKFYKDALDRKSFQYDKYKKWLEKCKFVVESSSNNNSVPKLNREIVDNEEVKSTSSPYNEKMLEMILNIQAIILKYLKNNNESE